MSAPITFSKEIGFLATCLVVGAILFFATVNETKVAELRLEHLLRSESTFGEEVYRLCHTLAPTTNDRVERVFISRFSPTQPWPGAQKCELKVARSSYHRFLIRSYWGFTADIRREDGTNVASQLYKIDFPLPAALLPLVIFLIALAYDVRAWNLGWTVVSFLFLLGGGNLIRTVEKSLHYAWSTITADPGFIGMLLIAFWLALYRFGRDETRKERKSTPDWQKFLNRVSIYTMGLWSPAFFTLFGRVIFPFRGQLLRQVQFLDAQVLVACASLYLLSVDAYHLKGFLKNSLLLPRYFTYTVFLLLVFRPAADKSKFSLVLWHLPRFWQHFGAIAIVEVLSFQFAWLNELPTLTRVGIALSLSELAHRRLTGWKTTMMYFAPAGGMLFLISFLSVVAIEMGVLDLAIVMLDPSQHPTWIVLFTFLAGLGVGFLTGSLSATFLGLFTLMMRSYDIPLVRAALLDGVLAGSLLSPFSLYNLFPMVQYHLKLHDLIRFRFRQLFLPLLIGSVIYTVSAINSVAILRPVTFVFLCLVAVAYQMRKSEWYPPSLRHIWNNS